MECKVHYVRKKWLDEKQAANYTSLSKRKLFDLRMSGRLSYCKVDGKILYDIDILDNFVENNRVI